MVRKKTHSNRMAILLSVISVGLMVAIGVGAFRSRLFWLNQVQVLPFSEEYPLTIEQVLEVAAIPIGAIHLFSLDLVPIEKRLAALPWVKGVVVSKQLPNTLVIRVIERRPVALMNDARGQIGYLEEDGSTFDDPMMGWVPELPLLSGLSSTDSVRLKKMGQFIRTWFQAPELSKVRLSSLSLDDTDGLKAMVMIREKDRPVTRTVLEMGMNIEEAERIPVQRLRRVLDYLASKGTPVSKIWLGDGKKIIVKVSRGS